MPKLIKKNQAGFSLVEMMLYVAILSFLLIVISNVLISINRSQKSLSASRNIETSAALALERITREVRGAGNIDTTGSVFNVHPGRLVLEVYDELGNMREVEFYAASGEVRMVEDGVEVGSLTTPGANASNLVFRHFSSASSEGVRIELTLESGTSTAYRTVNFYSTAVLRKAI